MKYKPDSLESNIVKEIFNSLAGDIGYFPQFMPNKIADGFADLINGEIEFDYLPERALKKNPKPYKIRITVDVFPTEE